jgi:hypothetical protein
MEIEMGIKQPMVNEKIVSNVWFHTMKFEHAGDYKLGHKHNFNHAHLVCEGSVEVFQMEYKDGKQGANRESIGIFKQGDIFLVPSDMSHTVVALEDGTFAACIQAMRDDETEEVVSAFCNDVNWESDHKIQL